MKYLLPLFFLCLLLCGCTAQTLPEEDILPSESVAGEMLQPEQYGGSVSVFPLNLHNLREFRTVSDRLLLFSGLDSTTLTLLDGNSLEEYAHITLDFQLEADDPSLRQHPDGSISCFDPIREETLVLSSTLEELRRIQAPGNLSGTPILSPDGRILYYCTVSDVRAWDLESGIRRCVKEMSFDSQQLTGLLLNGAVLQCLVSDGGAQRTRFFSSENGRLLFEGSGIFSVLTDETFFYASVPAGYNRVQVFGEYNREPQIFLPAATDAEAFFLPKLHAACTVRTQEDCRIQLEYYDLSTGSRTDFLTLDPYLTSKSIGQIGNSLYILSYDPALDQDILFRWNPGTQAREELIYTETYHSANQPDRNTLADLQQKADLLGSRYGIRILLGEEAVSTEPWDYNLTPEHLAPLIRQELMLLEQRLAQYPEAMLQQTASHFSGLNLCLVRSLSGISGGLSDATGVQFLNGTEAYVVIATGPFSGQALYHELFHVMETHIFAESIAFDRWNELNPAGFQYDYDYAANARRDSGVYLFLDSRSFVDTYSMSFPKEDRARIMEYAMLPGNRELFTSETMQAKLQTLCTGIREAYGLEDAEEAFLWEQYLDK